MKLIKACNREIFLTMKVKISWIISNRRYYNSRPTSTSISVSHTIYVYAINGNPQSLICLSIN